MITTKPRNITADSFQKFLTWLNPDFELAGEKYREIHLRLTRIFQYRGCSKSEELADETINRVIEKLDSIIEEYKGDPASYFFGVANFVYMEYQRSPDARAAELPVTMPASEVEEEDDDGRHECLERCLQELKGEERELILQYYSQEKGRKIEKRRFLSSENQISPEALRKRTQRIREQLKKCMANCMKNM
jgi:RNA polymerase sigma factor (sigma-70 family)